MREITRRLILTSAVMLFGCATGVEESALPGDARPIDSTSDGSGGDSATSPPKDSGGDASSVDTSAEPDSTIDGGEEAEPDGGADTGEGDTGTLDTGTDTGAPDTGTDTGGLDTGTTDTGTDAVVTGDKRVFVSSMTYTGDLGGVGGADAKCQSLAVAAGLTGAYMAWLSDATSSAASRLTHSTGKYVLVDNTTVATSWTALTTVNLLHAIDMTESKGTAPLGTTTCGPGGTGGKVVWSDTLASGATSTPTGNCGNWGSTAATSANWGFSDKVDSNWSQGCSGGGAVCVWKAALYCFEQ
jgi:hypothetical protein